MCLAVKVKSDTVKKNGAEETGMLGSQIKVNWTRPGRRWQEWTQTSGISELTWTGTGGFNSDDHCIFHCGQEPLRRNGVALRVNKSLKCSTWVQSQKLQNDLCSFPSQTIQYHRNPSPSPNH